jgi:NitT/TauT family transport system permease protein
MASISERARDRAGRVGRFLWSGWAGVAGLALFAALWQAAHEAWGALVLPAPLAAARAAGRLAVDPDNAAAVAVTLGRALAGFAAAGLVATGLGVACGYSAAAMRAARPILTLVVGVPPIAWMVLALLWFGSSDATVALTVAVAAGPILFAAAAEGIAGRDRTLDAMARSFGATALARFATLGLRQAAGHILPALALALGASVKVAVMAELLTSTGGVGGALATARANLDIEEATAWVLIAVAGLVAAETLLIAPLRAEAERWREAERPWGVRRQSPPAPPARKPA